MIWKREFYQLGLKLWQFVSRATDLGIDFRKLVYEDNDSGYKSVCTNEKTVDDKGSLRGKEFVYVIE